MIKPEMPNFPGMGAMNDTLEFVKNLWGGMGIPGTNIPGMSGGQGMNFGGMNVPGMVMPTLSIEEINKKIADLRAVENWLNLNMNMLRGTIQALEVQAATISTLQTMSETFTASMQSGAKDWTSAQMSASSGNGQGRAGAHGGDASTSGNGAGDAHSAASASASSENRHGAPEPTSKDESAAANLTAPLVNAAAWWNMLQEQFKQAVTNAMVDVPTAASAASTASESSGAKATAKSAAKPKADQEEKPVSSARKPKSPK
jgi:hypothetical protein